MPSFTSNRLASPAGHAVCPTTAVMAANPFAASGSQRATFQPEAFLGSIGIEPKQPPKQPSPQFQVALKTSKHVAKASALIAGALLLKKLPLRQSTFKLLPTDWKEWAKVFLAIGGINEAQKAVRWEPPVWLGAMMNVALVTPMLTRFNAISILQGLILSPLVGGLAGLNHYLGEKAADPAQRYLHLPATATHIILSALTALSGLAILPAVSKAIPVPAKSWPLSKYLQNTNSSQAAARAGVGTICSNGCCASLICANEAGQMGAAVLDSYQSRHGHKTDNHPEDR